MLEYIAGLSWGAFGTFMMVIVGPILAPFLLIFKVIFGHYPFGLK